MARTAKRVLRGPRLLAGLCALACASPFGVLGAEEPPVPAPPLAGAADPANEPDVALSDGDVVDESPGEVVPPADPQAPQNTVKPSAATRQAAERSEGSGLSWGRAPITWRGALTATYDMSSASGSSSTRSFGKAAAFSGDSYIYAPWLARVNGGFNLSQTSVLSSPKGESSGYGADLGVTVFPVSRFPFSANASRSAVGDFVFSRYLLSQTYIPASENFSTAAQYERSVFESPGLSNVIHRFTGNYRQNLRSEYPQTLFGTWNFGFTRPSTGASRADAYEARVEHTANLYDDYGLTLANNASYVRSINYGDPATGDGRIGARFAYLSSGNSWEPFVDLPLVIHSSLSHSSAALTADGLTTFIDTTSGEVRSAYSFGNYLSLSVAGRFDHVRTPGETRTTTAFSVVAQSGYGVGSITQFDLLGFKYQLSYNASAGILAQSDGDLAPTVGGAVTQSLTRDFDVGLGLVAPLSFLLSQAYGVAWTRGRESTKTVTTSLNLNWQYSQARYGFSSRFEAQDGRTIEARNPAHFQSIRWDNQGRLLLSPVSSLNAALTVGWSRQGARPALQDEGDVRLGDWTGSGTGTVNYQNVRFFDVPRLAYTAAYAISFRPGLLADDDRGRGHHQNFTQRLNYTIGKLRLGADHAITIFGGQAAQTLNLTVTRELSGVL